MQAAFPARPIQRLHTSQRSPRIDVKLAKVCCRVSIEEPLVQVLMAVYGVCLNCQKKAIISNLLIGDAIKVYIWK